VVLRFRASPDVVSTFPIDPQEAGRVDWLLLATLGIMWAAFLVPAGRKRSASASVEEFERRMELLAYTEAHGTNGRWIVTPRKGVRFVGAAERHRARARVRRRRILVALLEAIGITGLMGSVPPLRAVWSVTMALAVLLVLYVWLLLAIKQRTAPAAPGGVAMRAKVGAAQAPGRATRPATARHVADGAMGWARPTFNGLAGMGEGDRVHVVVRHASAAAGA
jgi:hypothetical protein